MPGRDLADTAEATAAGCDMALQYRIRCIADSQVAEANDAGIDARIAITAACAHGCKAVGEFRFADRSKLGRAGVAMERAAFHENSGRKCVATAHVVEQIEIEIPAFGAIPEMMMAVDDGKVRLQDRLVVKREPIRADREMRIRRIEANAHRDVPLSWACLAGLWPARILSCAVALVEGLRSVA